jgi:hypothetical protein
MPHAPVPAAPTSRARLQLQLRLRVCHFFETVLTMMQIGVSLPRQLTELPCLGIHLLRHRTSAPA